MVKFSCMTRKELNELSIFALREFARRTGVYSPTCKKKDELIDEIIEISEGRKQPYIAKTKQGRPPKNYGYPFVDSFVGMQNSPIYSNSTLMQNSQFTYDDNITTVNGYAEISSSNSLLWVYQKGKMACLHLPKGMVDNYNLKSGDLVMVELQNGERNVEKILNINRTCIAKHNKVRTDFGTIEHKRESEKLMFTNPTYASFGVNVGDNVYLYGSNNVQNSMAVVEMLKNCQADRKIYINVSIVDKNRFILNDLKDVECFVTDFADPIDDARRTVILATERAKRIVEMGESCVIAVDDVQSVRGVDVEDLHVTKTLMSIAKNGANNGSVTMLAVMVPSRSLDIFEKLADRRLKLNENNTITTE